EIGVADRDAVPMRIKGAILRVMGGAVHGGLLLHIYGCLFTGMCLLVLGADYPFCPVRSATASSACPDRLLISQADIVAHLFRLRVATPRCILLHWKTNLSLSSAVVRPA